MDTNKNADKPYDLTSIFAMTEDNPGFLTKLILVFYDNISNDILLINEAAKANNWKEVGQLAHKMKPSLKHFGIISLTDIIIHLEHPTNTDPQYLASLTAKLNDGINDVLSGLKKEFSEVFNQ